MEIEQKANMSHIVIDARIIYTSTGRYIERLIHYLQQVDTVNRYTILIKPADYDKLTLPNPNFTKLASPYDDFSFGEQIGLAKQLYSLKADLVHFGMTQQPLLYLKPSVTTIHDLTTIRFDNPDKNKLAFRIKQQIYKVVILWAAYKSKRVIVPSRFVADDVTHYTHAADKTTVTYESADKIDSPATALPHLQNKKFIMYIGRPTPHKNLPRLIEAFLQADDPALHLVLAGKLDANYRRLQSQHADNPRIVFTDFISEGELRWLYEQTDGYFMPSLSEGFGLPGLEAMRNGAPLASSNGTCLPEVYGDAALYFDPLSVPDITAAINKLTGDELLRDKLRAAGAEQRQKYSWKKMAEETLAVYNGAIN